MAHNIVKIETTPYQDQEPGTSGLRKKVTRFQEKNYTENFVQSILSAMGAEAVKGSVLVVGGDGRYYMKDAILLIIQICAGNGVSKLIIGQNGILSTPAVSNLIRRKKADGGIILTASHNPGGPDKDFGIKFNTRNGGPAPQSVTEEIKNQSLNIKQFLTCPTINCSIETVGEYKYLVCNWLQVLALLFYRYLIEIPSSPYHVASKERLLIVAKKHNMNFYEVPTGWKFFGNLMDAGQLSLCGEESFGTGSDHIREKDGIWAALAWLQVIACEKKGVQCLVSRHWEKYGRNFFTRYDYEDCDAQECKKMMTKIEELITSSTFVGKTYSPGNKKYTVQLGDNFSYKDPIDGSTSVKQGLRVLFEDGSRIIFRLSGTGSSGATVRLYIDSYETEKDLIFCDAEVG
ncbi:hypothetical protein C0J52_05477 [Blattella germanica]|nr:hypothetical protein C0J52_05477 [Blattella germanica]